MLFAAPWWLLFLLPWAGVTVWLLWGRRRATAVPFLALWQSDQPVQRARRWIELPFAALALAIAAMALAILAAAGPMILTHRAGGNATVALILDRGITMSPEARWKSALDDARAAISAFGPGPLDYVPVPDGRLQHVDRAGWFELAQRDLPVMLDTHEAVALAVRQALARTSGPVLVVSDHPLAQDRRIVQIAPQEAIEDVGITRLAARRSPRPQVMVAIRNQSLLSSATLIITSDASSSRQSIELPPAGQSQNYFLDVPRIEHTISARVDVHDDLPSNNSASVTVHALWPAVQVRDPVEPAVRRIIDAYSRARPPASGSAVIALTSAADETPPTTRAVIIADTSASPVRRIDSTLVTTSALSTQVDWHSIKTAALAPNPPEGFEPIVRMDGHIALAARQSPARQVWVGFDAPGFDKMTDFAVFWTHVLDWTGQAGDENLASISPPAVIIDPPQPATWRQKLASLGTQTHHRISLASWLLFGSMFCLLLAAGSWQRLTRFSPLRTV